MILLYFLVFFTLAVVSDSKSPYEPTDELRAINEMLHNAKINSKDGGKMFHLQDKRPRVDNFLKEIQTKFAILAEGTMNASNGRNETLRAGKLCMGPGTSPNRILIDVYFALVNECRPELSAEERSRFSYSLALLSPYDIPLSTKSSVAYFTAKQAYFSTKQEPQDVVDKFIHNLRKYEKDHIFYADKMKIALEELDSPNKKSYCLLDTVFYTNFCNRKKLMDFINLIPEIFKRIEESAKKCAPLLWNDQSQVPDYVEMIMEQFGTVNDRLNRYISANIAQNNCDMAVINQTIIDFSPNGLVLPQLYEILAEQILNALSEFGTSTLRRHVVILPFLAINEGYLPICPADNCRIIEHRSRGVILFYSWHEPPSESTIGNTQQFFNQSTLLIDDVIWKMSASNNLNSIRQELAKKNVQLTGNNRFQVELWVRKSAAFFDCPLETTISSNSNNTDNIILNYYFRNRLLPFACQNYKIYVLP